MFGTTEVPLTKREGVFRCPGCRTLRKYQWRGIRRFLTVYFVPVLPLMEVSEHVRCMICHERFSPRILSDGWTGGRIDSANISGVVILAALRLVLGDGQPTREELVELQLLVRERTRIYLERSELLEMAPWVAGPDALDAAAWLSRGRGMSELQIERAVRDLFRVASADGRLRDAQLKELASFPPRLGIGGRRFRKLIEQACTVATVDGQGGPQGSR